MDLSSPPFVDVDGDVEGVARDFFGETTTLPSGAALLARRSRAKESGSLARDEAPWRLVESQCHVAAASAAAAAAAAAKPAKQTAASRALPRMAIHKAASRLLLVDPVIPESTPETTPPTTTTTATTTTTTTTRAKTVRRKTTPVSVLAVASASATDDDDADDRAWWAEDKDDKDATREETCDADADATATPWWKKVASNDSILTLSIDATLPPLASPPAPALPPKRVDAATRAMSAARRLSAALDAERVRFETRTRACRDRARDISARFERAFLAPKGTALDRERQREGAMRDLGANVALIEPVVSAALDERASRASGSDATATAAVAAAVARASGAFYTLVPIRPRRRGER